METTGATIEGLCFLRGPCRGVIRKKRFRAESVESQAVNHDNENVRNIGQGEARHRKYKRLKLGGGHAYDRSSN
jgi:hypothetical protein